MPPPLARPFAALRPAPSYAAEVAAPPYDVLSSEEARERAAGRPWSFLHVSKPEIDLPPGTDPHDPAVYATARANLDRMVAAGVLARDAAPTMSIVSPAASTSRPGSQSLPRSRRTARTGCGGTSTRGPTRKTTASVTWRR
jgi:uncharacterized protein (DUF1015 family)